MWNCKLILEYDGTEYCGWQRQENGKTVQGELEAALAQLLREHVSVNGAGRTDAGVHARGQAANFRTDSGLPPVRIMAGLNALLPGDITVLSSGEAPDAFHARYSARGREYSYLIARQPTSLMRHYSWHVPYPLDLGAMEKASALLPGTHDFRSFCKSEAALPHYRCTVSAACWQSEGSFLTFRIRADRFLHGMVRALVGTMVDIGRGYTPFDEFGRIFDSLDRRSAGAAAPAKGLVLEQVIY